MREIVVYIRSRNKFGDQIVSFAALYQLKQWWPDAQLRIAAQHDVASYYRLLPWVDDFIRYGSFLQMLRSLPRKTDMAVCLHHSSERYGLVTLLRQATVRLGFSNDRVFDFAWTHSWRKNVNEYIGLANLYLLNAYRPVDPESTFRRCFERIAALAPEARAQAHVVLIPGGGDGNFKRWGIRNFVALVDLLKARLGPHTRFAFVLGPAESAERTALQALNRPDFELVSGCSFPELTALMLRARLVVANDCGPSHIGQGVCVPYVGVFNDANPEWFWDRPYSRHVCPSDGSSDIQKVDPHKVAQACFEVMAGA